METRARACMCVCVGGRGNKMKYIMKDTERSIFDIYYDQYIIIVIIKMSLHN